MIWKMHLKTLQKYVCCTLDVTIGARIIGFIGLMISVLLITVLLNDTYFDEKDNYDVSRKTALALGLDWQHFHPKASTSQKDDMEGKKITTIVIFYSVAFLLLNILLCLATIMSDWRYAIPWLVCEFLGCLSKFGALIYHLQCDQNDLSNIFIIGSLLYIVTMVWWWTVVYLAQLSWRRKSNMEANLELCSVITLESTDTKDVPGKIRYFPDAVENTSNMDSPGPYAPNIMYALI